MRWPGACRTMHICSVRLQTSRRPRRRSYGWKQRLERRRRGRHKRRHRRRRRFNRIRRWCRDKATSLAKATLLAKTTLWVATGSRWRGAMDSRWPLRRPGWTHSRSSSPSPSRALQAVLRLTLLLQSLPAQSLTSALRWQWNLTLACTHPWARSSKRRSRLLAASNRGSCASWPLRRAAWGLPLSPPTAQLSSGGWPLHLSLSPRTPPSIAYTDPSVPCFRPCAKWRRCRGRCGPAT